MQVSKKYKIVIAEKQNTKRIEKIIYRKESISIGIKSDRNDSASTLNHISESTMETSTTSQHFTDIAFTIPNIVPLTINDDVND